MKYPPAKIYEFDCFPEKASVGKAVRTVLSVVFNYAYSKVLLEWFNDVTDEYKNEIPEEVVVEFLDTLNMVNTNIKNGLSDLEKELKNLK